MFHVSAFSKTVTGLATDSLLPAVFDGWANVDNDRLMVPNRTNLIAAWAFGNNIVRAALFAEPFRKVAPLEIVPTTDLGGAVSSLGLPFYPPSGKVLDTFHRLEGIVTNGSANPVNQTILVFFGETPSPLTSGDIYTIKFSYTVAAVAHKWVMTNTDLVGDIPFGIYKVVGMFAYSPQPAAIRLRLSNQRMCPGTLCNLGGNRPANTDFRRGGIGIWGEFKSTNPPYIEVLAQSSESLTGVVWLDVIRE